MKFIEIVIPETKKETAQPQVEVAFLQSTVAMVNLLDLLYGK